jgi:hypothetical protein
MQILTFGVIAIVLLVTSARDAKTLVLGGGVSLLTLLILWLFGSLLVEVRPFEVTVQFGPGIIRRRIPVGSIVSAKAVQNSFLMGWGIRLIPGGWMFNIAGLQAVELGLKSGSVFRIGTDDPIRLEAAIKDVLRQ